MSGVGAKFVCFLKEIELSNSRNLIYSVAMSLDGFIAGPTGQYDWIPTDVGIDFQSFFNRFDTLLMGRKTYQLTLEQGPEAQIPGMNRYVFSSTLKALEHPEVTIVNPHDSIPLVNALKREAGKELWLFGGGELFASLLKAKLVDLIEVATIPILVGEGLPLLKHKYTQQKLEKLDSRNCKAGVVLSTFRPIYQS